MSNYNEPAMLILETAEYRCVSKGFTRLEKASLMIAQEMCQVLPAATNEVIVRQSVELAKAILDKAGEV